MSYLGENTPKLGFGLMRLPKDAQGNSDIETTSRMVDAFLDAGFTYFDTARAYGDSEAAIKAALVDRHPRDSYTLATKVAPWIGENTPETACAMFDTSLETTGAGYFDYYLLHNLGGPRTEVFERLGLWDFARELKDAGTIRHLGMSFHDTADVLKPILEAHADQLEFVQLQINWADWENDFVQSRACYELVRSFDLPVVIMEPVKGGVLADPPQPVKDVFAAADPSRSPAEWALRFAANLDGVITVLSGMSTFDQMESNLATFRAMTPLTDDERSVYARAREAMDAMDLVSCTACGYCRKDCPNDISIPAIMAALNYYRLYDDGDAGTSAGRPRASATNSQGQYDWGVSQGAKAGLCIECGNCEAACPQGLPIIDLLKEAVDIFESDDPDQPKKPTMAVLADAEDRDR